MNTEGATSDSTGSDRNQSEGFDQNQSEGSDRNQSEGSDRNQSEGFDRNQSDRDGLVPALLRDWRRRRGLSQLDLALSADVSARHISFLETGRSTPSKEMVLRLGAAAGVSMRQIDTMLRAAGHEPIHRDNAVPESIRSAIELLGRHLDPAPMVVIDRLYDVVTTNRGGRALFTAIGQPVASASWDSAGAPDRHAERPNLARLTFDPGAAQPLIVNFDDVGRELLWRIHREVLDDPSDAELRELLDHVLAMPTVRADWRTPDLAHASEPALVVHLRSGDLELRFLTTVTVFQAPQNTLVEQLRIETWIPADDATARAWTALVELLADEPATTGPDASTG